MATLKQTFTLSSDSLSSNRTITFSDTMDVTDPVVGLTRQASTAAGADNILVKDGHVATYLYVKNLGLTTADAADTTLLMIETTNNIQIGSLKAGEALFMPVGTGANDATDTGIQVQGDANGPLFEYAVWTKA